MGGVKLVIKHIQCNDGIMFEFPSEPYRTSIKNLLKKCDEKTNGYVSLEIDRPYKPRTTGQNSQNNLVWKLITIVANEMGEDTDYVENLVKIKATSKGYPYKTIEGQIVPSSMATINTVECSYLIDTLYEQCAFLGINLSPDLIIKEPVQETNTESLVNEIGDIF